MQWSDEGIIISLRRHGEHSAIMRVLTPSHGLRAGVVRGVLSKTKRGMYQIGNLLALRWQGRLSEQLGWFEAELRTPYAAQLMASSAALSALTSACAMVEAMLPEHEPHGETYMAFMQLLEALTQATGYDTAKELVKFELVFLSDCGFQLDLSSCAATGQRHDLHYVSPKSGRAVSREAGEPYKQKLLLLPHFLQHSPAHNQPEEREEALAGLRLTAYFIEHWLLTPHGRKMPAARARLMQEMMQAA